MICYDMHFLIFISDILLSMNANNSLSQYDYQRSNQMRNLTTTINSILSIKQFPSTNDQLTFVSVFIRNKFIFLIIFSLLILLLSILVFLIILKRTRKQKQPTLEGHFEPEPNPHDDPHSTLLPQTNIRIDSRNPILKQKLTDPSLEKSRDSSSSISSKHLSTTNDNDDLSDLDLNNIPFHSIEPSDSTPIDRFPPEIYEHPYIAEFKEREKENLKARKYSHVSNSPTSSEESCL